MAGSYETDLAASAANEVWVGGVGAHQKVLAGLPKVVQVELFPLVREESVSARIDGVKIGEVSADRKLYQVLLARRNAGMPPVFVRGEVRRGERVARYVAVFVPLDAELMALAPEGWVMPIPSEIPVSVHGLAAHQAELAEIGAAGKTLEAQVEFGTTSSGKFAGQPCGVVTVDGVEIGVFSAAFPEKWMQIYEDRENGVPGRLLVDIYAPSGSQKTWSVGAIYKRKPNS